MVGDLLRHFQLAAVLQIRGDAGRTESMIADARFDAGRSRAPADDAVGVLLEEGIGCKLARLPTGGARDLAAPVGFLRRNHRRCQSRMMARGHRSRLAPAATLPARPDDPRGCLALAYIELPEVAA
jgi:hypothetical protein